MKKNIRLIIIFCVIALILAGLMIFLMSSAPAEEEEKPEDTSSPASRLLYDANPQDISVLSIKNEHGEYEIIRIGEGESAAWTVPDIADMPMSTSKMTDLLEAAASVTAQQTVAEAPEDISIYGLNEPSAVIKAEFSDSAKTVRTLTLGNLAPDGNKRYVTLDGGTEVYAVLDSKISCFLKDKYDIINKVVYTAKTGETDEETAKYSTLKKITVKRKDIDYDFVVEYDVRLDDENIVTGNSSSYVVTSPIFRDMNPDNSKDFVSMIFGLTASDLAVLNPNEEDMEKYGISDPDAEVTFEVNGGDTVRLLIGKEHRDEDGKKAGRYVTVNDTPIIYIFNESSLPWLTAKPLDLVTAMIASNYVYDIKTLDITGSGIDMNFTMTGSGADDFAVKLGGTDMDTAAFKSFYQFILRIPSDELYFEDTDAEPIVSIDIRTKDGGDLIEFLPSEGRKVIIRMNGKSVYKCTSAYVDRLIDNANRYQNGDPLIENW